MPDAARVRPALAIIALLLTGVLASTSRAETAPSTAQAPAQTPAQPNEAASYSLGLSFASQWRDSGLEGVLAEDALIRGIRAGLSGAPLSADDRQRASTLLHDSYEAWATRNKKAAGEFLARNAKEPGVRSTASGLQYLILAKGEAKGAKTGPNDQVTVQYRGTFQNGAEFDSTYSRGKPAVIRPGMVIEGWREVLPMMSKGSKWRLFVPPELGYGLKPPPSIPPNSLLIFEIEIVDIQSSAAPAGAAK